MPLLGGGRLGTGKISKSIRLNDSAGVDKFELKDSDGFVIFKIDSKGNVYTRRAITRIWNLKYLFQY